MVFLHASEGFANIACFDNILEAVWVIDSIVSALTVCYVIVLTNSALEYQNVLGIRGWFCALASIAVSADISYRRANRLAR